MTETVNKTKRPNLARRPRMYPDWPISIYSFDCWPQEKPPQSLWDTAWQMRKLWNELAAVLKTARAHDGKNGEGKYRLTKDERRALYHPFEQRKTTRSENNEKYADRYDLAQQLWGGEVPSLAAIGAQYRGIIPSACYEAVIKRFIVTYKEWRKNPKTPTNPNGKGAPGFQGGPLMKINIPLTFNSGITPEQLATGTTAKICDTYDLRHERTVEGEKLQEYLNNGWFTVGLKGDRWPLHIAMHRPFPAKTRIKQVALVGKRSNSLGWRWQLQAQVEHPPQASHQITKRVAGLDLGWRVMDGYLRVGFLTDNAGHQYEITVPMDFGNRRTRRHNRRAAMKGFNPIVSEWVQMDKADRALAQKLENCKDTVKEMAEALPAEQRPKALRNFLTHKDRVRQTGLRSLQARLEAEDQCPEVAAVLSEWDGQTRIGQRRIGGASAKSLDHRTDGYRKVAAWLAANFDEVAWEGDLKLKELAEDETTDPALRNAAGWRFVASLSNLRRFIKESLGKTQRKPVDRPAAYSSALCFKCGGKVLTDARKRLRVCENGHQNDQDANATRWFLSELPEHASTTLPPVEIPHELRGYLRLVPANEA